MDTLTDCEHAGEEQPTRERSADRGGRRRPGRAGGHCPAGQGAPPGPAVREHGAAGWSLGLSDQDFSGGSVVSTMRRACWSSRRRGGTSTARAAGPSPRCSTGQAPPCPRPSRRPIGSPTAPSSLAHRPRRAVRGARDALRHGRRRPVAQPRRPPRRRLADRTQAGLGGRADRQGRAHRARAAPDPGGADRRRSRRRDRPSAPGRRAAGRCVPAGRRPGDHPGLVRGDPVDRTSVRQVDAAVGCGPTTRTAPAGPRPWSTT